MALANLSVKVSADIGSFTSGMDQASKVAKDRMGQSAGAADAFRSSLLQTSAAMQQMAAAMSANMGAANDAITKGSIESAAAIAGIGTAAGATNLSGFEKHAKDAFGNVVEQSKTMAQRVTDNIKEGFGTGMEVAKKAVEGALAVRAAALLSAELGVLAKSLLRVYALYSAIKAVASFGVGLVTGDSYKSESIDALLEKNKQVKELQNSLYLTAQQASATDAALTAMGTNKTDYTSVYQKATDAIHSNVEELDRLGVKHKDEYELVQSANEVLNQYTEGWDRNQAAQAIGIGTAAQVAAAAEVTKSSLAEAAATMREYNTGMGEESQAAAKRYEDAMRAFNNANTATSNGFKRAWADQIMPILTDFAEFFTDGWPKVVAAFRYGMATVTSLFYGLKTVVYAVAESIVGSMSAIGSALGGVATAGMKLLTGDFTGAKDALVKGWDDAKSRIGQTGDNIVAQAKHNMAAVRLAWAMDDRNDAPKDKAKKGNKWIPKSEKEDAPVAAQVRQDPFEGAMNSLGSQVAGIDYVIANFDKFEGKVKESKAAMAEFDVTMGKFSDKQRASEKFEPLTAAQKAEYIATSKYLQDQVETERQLQVLRKFDKEGDKFDFKEKQALDFRRQDVEWMGKSAQELAKLTEARRIDGEIAARIYQLQADLGRDGLKITQAQIDVENARGDALKAASSKVIDQGYDKAKDPWFNYQQSIRQYGDEAQNVGQQIGQAMTNAFKGAEDALVTFATTGKLSFKGLAQSILADLARIQAKSLIASLTGAGSNAVGSLGGGLGGLLQQWTTMAGAGGSSSATNGMGIMGDVIAGARAEGGPVAGGSNYLVGEKEAETFKPSVFGIAVPAFSMPKQGSLVAKGTGKLTPKAEAINKPERLHEFACI